MMVTPRAQAEKWRPMTSPRFCTRCGQTDPAAFYARQPGYCRECRIWINRAHKAEKRAVYNAAHAARRALRRAERKLEHIAAEVGRVQTALNAKLDELAAARALVRVREAHHASAKACGTARPVSPPPWGYHNSAACLATQSAGAS
jgi:hypothetical protein